MARIELRYGAATDVGRVRETNEDAQLALPPVFVVADGMGGHHAGDVASGIVVEEFARLVGLEADPANGAQAINEALATCQQRIHEYAARQPNAGPVEWYAGTTAVVALLVHAADGPHWLLANVGDSRVYRLVGETLDQVSVDHSLVQELVDAGRISREQAAQHPERNVVTRALGGPDEGTEPDFFLLPVSLVDRLLLCSDGVTEMVDDDTIARLLAEGSPQQAADALVAAAVAAGGVDNATAVVVEAAEPSG